MSAPRLKRAASVGLLGATGLVLLGVVGFAVLDRLFPFPLERLERRPATLVVDRDGEPLRLFLPPDGIVRLPVRLDDVSPVMRRALVASEDRWFRHHPGVNPLALARAAWQNLRAGRVVSGASTLSMQLARMAEPRPRDLWAKAVEAFRALQLERRFTKDELLELYLNRAPFGGPVEGIGAAAWLSFGKGPAELSLGEAALLTALPRAPVAYDPTRHPEAARRVRDRVLAQLAVRGVFPEAEVARARRQPVPHERRPLPFLAPHFARLASGRAAPKEGHTVATELDAATQRAAEALVAGRVAALRPRGIGNAAAVVIETKSRAVRALVGSADFFDPERPGQVNGALARRSPGSTLKPFLYALAFDRGLTAPEAWLLDVPTDFAGWSPENYDGTYLGRVTAREALARSLNVPAARLLARVGLARFLGVLRAGGLETLDRPAHAYGLPLVLGGGEVRLLELTNLYATLAEGGAHRAARLLPGPAVPARRLFSTGAAALTTRVLTTVERPDLPEAWALARDAPTVAWKTGTSYGHRDAWAVGFSRHFAVGVWVGNLDGTPRPGISGSEHAAPLLFDLFRAIEPGGGALPATDSAAIAGVEVCSLSHERPTPFCPARIEVPVLPGVTRLRPCTHHRRIFVDGETGERLAGRCLAERPHRPQVVTSFPDELVAWWRSAGRPSEELPPLAAGCRSIPGGGPRIVSPTEDTPYRLRREAPAAFQKLRLTAAAAPGTAKLYWYQDGTLVAAAAPDTRVFVPLARGRHRLVLVDDAGRSDAIDYRVE
ncbi:MAG: penicillin-binding protein 1C [Myxococcota bacterium]|nr:penicillin-binding protein 1C [Myxococcota bacterium]